MKTLVDQLAQYASYHRDPRNLATHLVGIPLIVVGVTALLARASIDAHGVPLSAALAAGVTAVGYYLLLDLRLGLAMAIAIGAAVAAGTRIAALPVAAWLAWSVALFVVGWVFQFVGHHVEGRKPAFVDDVVGLVIGPLFVVAELAFMLGLRRSLQRDVEARSGPMRRRPAHDAHATPGREA